MTLQKEPQAAAQSSSMAVCGILSRETSPSYWKPLHERGLLARNAPHLVSHQAFVVPGYTWWEGPFYGIGLKLYDKLARELGLGPSEMLSREETLAKIPTLEPEDLHGGVIYYDGQFDDARLAINLAQTVHDLGGMPLNYFKVEGLAKVDGVVKGVTARDIETGLAYELRAKVVINATGVFSDSILKMDDPAAANIISPSQGVHLVLDQSFLPGDAAIMVPHTSDGRVLFAVPWHDRVIVGTTDTKVQAPTLEPVPLDHEIDFILEHAARYLTKDPTRADILSMFAGLRPLVGSGDGAPTSAISRDHTIIVSDSGLVTVAGGKWTTYRKMAEDTVNQAAFVGDLEKQPCVTEDLKIHGWLEEREGLNPLRYYGTDASGIRQLVESDPDLRELLHPNLPYSRAEVVWGARHEMARTVEDILARRTRALLLDARACLEIAGDVAQLLGAELGYDDSWRTDQTQSFTSVARQYLPNP